jgi:hypothetical protein
MQALGRLTLAPSASLDGPYHVFVITGPARAGGLDARLPAGKAGFHGSGAADQRLPKLTPTSTGSWSEER